MPTPGVSSPTGAGSEVDQLTALAQERSVLMARLVKLQAHVEELKQAEGRLVAVNQEMGRMLQSPVPPPPAPASAPKAPASGEDLASRMGEAAKRIKNLRPQTVIHAVMCFMSACTGKRFRPPQVFNTIKNIVFNDYAVGDDASINNVRTALLHLYNERRIKKDGRGVYFCASRKPAHAPTVGSGTSNAIEKYIRIHGESHTKKIRKGLLAQGMGLAESTVTSACAVMDKHRGILFRVRPCVYDLAERKNQHQGTRYAGKSRKKSRARAKSQKPDVREATARVLGQYPHGVHQSTLVAKLEPEGYLADSVRASCRTMKKQGRVISVGLGMYKLVQPAHQPSTPPRYPMASAPLVAQPQEAAS